MADMEQMQIQVSNLKMKRDKFQEDIDKHQLAITKLTEDKKKIQADIDKITGVQEESDAGITTTTAGNISKLGGSGNYAPKIGMTLSRKIKKKKKAIKETYNPYDSHVIEYMDSLFEKEV